MFKGNSNIANTFTSNNGKSGTVFKNTGGSHITVGNNSAHITTAIGGLNQKATYGVHIKVDTKCNVISSDFFGPKG